MTYEQIEGFFTPIYLFLAFGLIILVSISLICIVTYYGFRLEEDSKAKIKSLEERLKNKSEMDRLRYEHELILSEYKEKHNVK